MALISGTNCGFVTEAPSADPNTGIAATIDNYSRVTKFTAPLDAIKVTEMGWYAQNTTQSANFEVGIYTDDSGSPDELIGYNKTNTKDAATGWYSSVVDINISGGSVYWLGIQCDDTVTTTNILTDDEFGSYIYLPSSSTLPDPTWSGGTLVNGYSFAAYALYTTSGGNVISLPILQPNKFLSPI